MPRRTSRPDAGVGGTGPSAMADKRLKVTYYARKAETEALQQEIEVLRRRLRVLEQRQHPPDQAALLASLDQREALSVDVQRLDFTIAEAQALLSSYTTTQVARPLHSWIHLGTELCQRRLALTAIREARLEDGVRFMLARRRHIDLSRVQRHAEDYVAPNGDFVMVHFDITLFENVESVRQVYDEQMFYMRTQEMSITEEKGILTIREGDDGDEMSVSQMRLVSHIGRELTVETNNAVFTQYYAQSPLLAEPHAVLVSDPIDQDDLFPYDSSRHLRHDISAVSLMSAVPGQTRRRAQGKKITVAVSRWALIRVHRPACGLSAEDEDLARRQGTTGCDVMLRVMKERLAWRNASPSDTDDTHTDSSS